MKNVDFTNKSWLAGCVVHHRFVCLALSVWVSLSGCLREAYDMLLFVDDNEDDVNKQIVSYV